jgi:hypothetical protein
MSGGEPGPHPTRPGAASPARTQPGPPGPPGLARTAGVSRRVGTASPASTRPFLITC